MHPRRNAASKDAFGPPFLENLMICWTKNASKNAPKSDPKTISKNIGFPEALFLDSGPFLVPKRSGNRPPSLQGIYLKIIVLPRWNLCFWASGPLETNLFASRNAPSKREREKHDFQPIWASFERQNGTEKQEKNDSVFRRYGYYPEVVASQR